MSAPTAFDFAQIKIGDGATPTEAFTLICGIETVGLSEAAQTSERQLRDCAAPATPLVARCQARASPAPTNRAGGAKRAPTDTI